jgi:hypothetical protein
LTFVKLKSNTKQVSVATPESIASTLRLTKDITLILKIARRHLVIKKKPRVAIPENPIFPDLYHAKFL